ncbi:type VII secretion protein EccE [Antrihabitans sp. YC2-6]|nr:type VII secretion protein EccE [Antrihabitans sp. YC2-6]
MSERSKTVPSPFLGKVSLGNLLLAQGVGAVVWIVCLGFGVARWPALGAAILTGLVLLIRIAKQSSIDWLATARRYATARAYDIGRTVDFQGPSGRSLGLYWDGTRVVAVIEVLPPRGGLTKITREAFDSSHRLPITAIARCLEQHDITLSGIDVISHGHRSRSGTPAGGVYEQLIGPLPAVAVRKVWLAVALDTAVAAEAVQRRGGGTEGASRAVTVASQRIVRALDDAGCRSRILTAPEIREAVLQVSGGADPRELRHRWNHANVGENVNIGASIHPNRLGSDLLAKIWVAPSRGTTVAVRLRPGTSPETVAVGAAWRLTARVLPDRVRIPGLVSVNGRHREALLAHLPVGVAGLEANIPVHEFPIEDVDRLHLPSSGCGQLIGADDQSQGIATRIVGSGISTVYIAGELYIAQQVVFRALAVGARVLIRTDRPQAWENLVSTIASPDRLRIAGASNHSNAGFDTTMVDGRAAPAPHAGVTTIYLATDRSRLPAGTPDVALYQPGAIGNRVTLSTGTATSELSIVTIPRETAYIGRPRAVRPVPVG